MLEEFQNVIGPFAALFAGNVPRTCLAKQKSLFKEVDDLCDKFETFSQQDRLLLSLISRQANKLLPKHISTAAKMLSNGKTKVEKSIETFLKKISLYKYDWVFSPCIIIVDEHLDHMFWETLCLNPLQEVCRISCLTTLSKLYNKYKTLIKNGYLCLNIKKGNAVVNPDNNLPQNEKRMKLFFDYWMPSWNVLYNSKPTIDQLKDFLSSDCYM